MHPDEQSFSLGKKQQKSKDKDKNKDADDKEHEPNKRAKMTPASQLFPISMNGFDIQAENDDEIVLSTDLPGVKQADVKVHFKDGAIHIEAERKKGSAVQSFRRRLAVDEDAINLSNLRATLEDGILTVHVPQKKSSTNDKEDGSDEEITGDKTIVVVSNEPPVQPFELNMEIDVPGVKRNDLKVVLSKDGTVLTVSGERKHHNLGDSSRQGANNKMSEAYVLNKRKLDTSKLEAYLTDGVLTIRAPAKPNIEKIIPVNGILPPTKTDVVETPKEKKNNKEDKPKE
jgi:HSP20 family molecular chaperone IbpA